MFFPVGVGDATSKEGSDPCLVFLRTHPNLNCLSPNNGPLQKMVRTPLWTTPRMPQISPNNRNRHEWVQRRTTPNGVYFFRCHMACLKDSKSISLETNTQIPAWLLPASCWEVVKKTQALTSALLACPPVSNDRIRLLHGVPENPLSASF